MTTIEKARIIEAALDSKKVKDVRILDISGLTSLTEIFIICSCSSGVQVRASADEAEDKMKEAGFMVHHKEGYAAGEWALLDFGDIVVHVMTESTREFYDIERLWDEAEVIESHCTED